MLEKEYDKSRFYILRADARTVDGNKKTFNFNERMKYLKDKKVCAIDCVDINAGIYGPANMHKKHVFNISESDYDKVIDINLRAY
jgi:NAD(P)-dependent dehydrogenase (short-subunit alcohol dehydrogenase family)